jgi:hypothetical protein
MHCYLHSAPDLRNHVLTCPFMPKPVQVEARRQTLQILLCELKCIEEGGKPVETREQRGRPTGTSLGV